MPDIAEIRITFRHAIDEALKQQSPEKHPVLGNETKFVADLFHQWFTKFGTANFFLFKKNLRVTNLQFPELLALIRSEIRAADQSVRGDIQFVSPNEFDETVRQIATALAHLPSDDFAETLAELYSTLLERIVVIRAFYSSAVVFLPRHLTVDLTKVAASAGYVHSCGSAVYVRRMDKSSPEEFHRAIRRYLDTLPTDSRIMFEPFSHEDHTKHDREWERDLRSGLDDVKIYVEKLFVGEQRLVTFLTELAHTEERLAIPKPGDFHQTEAAARDQAGVLQDKTLWLISDRSVTHGAHRQYPGEDRYFICYEQRLRNEDPYHLFDESKPGWIAPVTIPHTLAGAMINITRPAWPAHDGVKIADPFVGSGTVWLEALKRPELHPVCTDLSLISPLLCRDNADWFQIEERKISEVRQRLLDLAERIADGTASGGRVLREDFAAYESAKRLFEPLAGPALENIQDVTFKPEVVEALARAPHRFQRLMFYLVVRTTVRNASAYLRRTGGLRAALFDEAWRAAFADELHGLAKTLKQLRVVRGREAELEPAAGNFRVFQGQYSRSCYVAIPSEAWHAYPTNVGDARSLPRNAYDVIVTDPPYGFNTDEQPEILARLYASVLPAMVGALRDNGQLVMCLPDQAFNGKKMFFFTQKELVIQQVLRAAEDFGFNVVAPSHSVPEPSQLFRPPYYWESERALRRAVVHFRFQRRADFDTSTLGSSG